MIYEFAATQDLHGYDKPWAPGAGKNIFNGTLEAGYIDSTGVIREPTSTIYCHSDFIPVTAGEKYTWSGVNGEQNNYKRLHFYDSNKDWVSNPAVTQVTLVDRAYSLTVTIPDSGVAYIALSLSFKDTSVMVEESATATAYAPYANICPPEGYNIWDPSQDKMIPVYAGYVNSNTRELYLRPVYEEYAGEELVGPWMSSLDPYAEDTTPTEGAFVIDFGGELTSFEITPFMLQTLLDSLGIRQHFTNGAGLLNKLMDQAQGRVRSEEELLHLSRPLNVIAIGDQLPAGLTFKPISKDVLPGLPGKFIR